MRTAGFGYGHDSGRWQERTEGLVRPASQRTVVGDQGAQAWPPALHGEGRGRGRLGRVEEGHAPDDTFSPSAGWSLRHVDTTPQVSVGQGRNVRRVGLLAGPPGRVGSLPTGVRAGDALPRAAPQDAADRDLAAA